MTRRILVAGDHAGVRATIGDLLDERGYEVITAENGALGLAAFSAAPSDLAITHIVMPVMEGLETIRAFRSERPDMPIIAVSAGARGPARSRPEAWHSSWGRQKVAAAPAPLLLQAASSGEGQRASAVVRHYLGGASRNLTKA
jgi:CheY-like chemotaxis protein